jgi:hypothetical protein
VGRDQQHPVIVILLDREGQPGRSRPVAVELQSKVFGPSSLTSRAPRAMGRGTRRPAWSAAVRQSHLGWQHSQFLSARAEAERAFQLAERLGSVRDGRNALVGWAVLFEG